MALTRPRRSRDERGGGFEFGEVVLAGVAESDVEREAAAKPLVEYAKEIPASGVGPLRFEDFPFQEEWYSEEVASARHVTLSKSAQIGASEWAMRIEIRDVDQFGDRGLYIFPTDTHVREFGDERLTPMIEGSKYLLGRIATKYVKTKSLKRIGRGFLYLRGSNSQAGAQSIGAQSIVFDEYDLLDQQNLVQIERRVSGAVQLGKVPKMRRLGYPFTPNAGIDSHFRASDQRIWHVVCKACGDEQPVVWEDNFRWTMPGSEYVHRPGDDEEFDDRTVLDRVWRCCRRCEASLEDSAQGVKDGALRSGRWIAQNPLSKRIGFHAWRGMVPVTDLEALVVASRATMAGERLAFYVLDLGRPFSDAKSTLTDGDLAAAAALGLERAVHAYTGPNPTTMGVDIGDSKGIHIQIDEQLPAEGGERMNPRRTLWVGTVQTWDEIAQLVRLFNVAVVALDYNPERRDARTLREQFYGRVVMVEFATAYGAAPMDLKLDDNGVPLRALVSRTDMLDGMMDAIRTRRSRPLQPQAWPVKWATQMKALHRKAELDTKGRPFYTYDTTGSDGDDYAFAAGYALIATELWRAFGWAHEQIVASQGRPVGEEEIGFRRVQLGMGVHDYDPGMGGV